MSLFGELDVAGVNDDPFFIDDGTYPAVCLEMKQGEKNGNKYVSIRWKVQEPGSQFDGRTPQNYFAMPDLNGVTSMDDLSVEDQDKIKRLRRCVRLAFDVPEDRISSITPADVVGRKVYITIKNNADKEDPTKMYTNVVDWKSEEAFSEQAKQFDTDF